MGNGESVVEKDPFDEYIKQVIQKYFKGCCDDSKQILKPHEGFFIENDPSDMESALDCDGEVDAMPSYEDSLLIVWEKHILPHLDCRTFGTLSVVSKKFRRVVKRNDKFWMKFFFEYHQLTMDEGLGLLSPALEISFRECCAFLYRVQIGRDYIPDEFDVFRTFPESKDFHPLKICLVR